MANIRKTFNFRNGVQVDDDNLIVNPNGLVGIGTSVPTEILDVRGTAKVVGLVTATEVFAENIRASGVSTFSGGIRAGIVSISQSGIVTATSGVVTYYGDGGRLLNLPTSQWLDVDIGLGFTSIYAQGFVGVGTTSPIYPFQVGGTDATRIFDGSTVFGVGIDTTGNIFSTGIVTARSYNGIGIGLTELNATNVTVGTLDNARLPSNINISGILTVPILRSNNLVVTGVTTSSGGFVGNVTGNVSGNIIGDVTGTASTALSLSGTPNIVVDIVTASQVLSNISSTGISTVTDRLFVQNSIGINTVSPTAEFHIIKNGVGGVHVTSTQESYVGVARTLTRGQQGGEIRFGNLADSFSGQTSLDLVNYDIGNVNQYIHLGVAGLGTGNFNWIYGQDQSAKMTLTYGGRLGIAKTNPDHELHVVGTSTITEDLYVGDDLFVHGDSNFVGDLTIGGNFTTPSLTVTGGINANLNNTSGVSTFYDIDVTNTAKITRIAISTDSTDYPLQIGNAQDSNVLVLSSANFIGIGTTVPLPQIQIYAYDAATLVRSVGIGTTLPRSAADFSLAGTGWDFDSKRFLLPPQVTTPQRNLLNTTDASTAGALVYNQTTSSLETWSGTNWISVGNTTISPKADYATVAGLATVAQILYAFPNGINASGAGPRNFAQIHDAEFYKDQVGNSVGIVTAYGTKFFLGSSAGIGTTDSGTPNQLLQITGGAYISGNAGIGTTNPGVKLDVIGDARITGVITATKFVGDGSGLTGIIGSGSGIVVRDSGVTVGVAGTIDFGSNLTVSALSAGIVTVTASGGGGGSGESYWAQSSAGIHTLSNVGVGTTNPQSALQVERYGVSTGFGTFSASAGITTDIDSFNITVTNFKTLEYTLHFENNNNIQSQKVLVMQNGSTAYSQEYAIMYQPSSIVSVGATITGTTCKLQVTPEIGISGLTTYRLVRQSMI